MKQIIDYLKDLFVNFILSVFVILGFLFQLSIVLFLLSFVVLFLTPPGWIILLCIGFKIIGIGG